MKKEFYELAKYRITKAEEAHADGCLLLDNGSFNGAVNRFYYAAFYAARALLATKNLDSSKHSGVLSYFNRYFIKDGLLPETPRSLNKQGIRTASTRRLPQVCRADP